MYRGHLLPRNGRLASCKGAKVDLSVSGAPRIRNSKKIDKLKKLKLAMTVADRLSSVQKELGQISFISDEL